ncbi:MAG: glycoside hydrolase family 2 protein [Nitrospinales bacterium]
MERIFQKSVKRKTIPLDGQWNIAFSPDNVGLEEIFPQDHNIPEHFTYIPSCWNFEPGRFDYMGIVWYSKKFITGEVANRRIIFHAVSGHATIFLDGKELGWHYGSYNRFSFDIPHLSAGEHRLDVKVDNTINDGDTLPLRFVDWYVYGGIYRSVELEQYKDLSIDGIKIDSEWNKYNVNKVLVDVTIKNWSNGPVPDTLALNIDGGKGYEKEVLLEPGLNTVIFELGDFDPEPWDIEKPILYMFHASLNSSQDDLFERTGFRKIETKGQRILLNGREIFIKGLNRHNEDPELGYAINAPLILRDLKIIKDSGANAIRGSHYPNDPIVLDYCDQMGLLFWEEIAFWNHPAESLADPLLGQRARTMMCETIKRDYNHPSIIIWSIQNESKSSSKEGYELFSKIAEDIRSLDHSRLISFASACGRDDICFDLVDVICWNMYPGWYDDDKPLDDLDSRFCKRLQDDRKWLDKKGFDKPYLVTEFGAGAVPGETTFHDGIRWTENYQEKLLQKTIKALMDSKSVQGFYIWQFCDIRTSLISKICLGRPRGFNNKGIVDEHRNPKRAYYAVKELLKKIKSYPG